MLVTKQKHSGDAFPLVARFPKTSLNFMTLQTPADPRPDLAILVPKASHVWAPSRVRRKVGHAASPGSTPAGLPQIQAAASRRKDLGRVSLTLHASVAPCEVGRVLLSTSQSSGLG